MRSLFLYLVGTAFTWRRIASVLLFISGLFATRTVQAQWQWAPAQSSDFPMANGTAYRVVDTGCEQVPLNNSQLRVACWNGYNGQLAWQYGTPGQSPLTGYIPLYRTPADEEGGEDFARSEVYDPDVVADPGNSGSRGGTKKDVLVTYLLGRPGAGAGQVRYKVYEYDSSINTMTLVQQGTLSQLGSNPNVDVDGSGQAVITWSENDAIYAQAYDMPNRTLYRPCEIAGKFGFSCTQPDVSVFHQGAGIVSFIYIVTDQGGQQTVNMHQVELVRIQNLPSVSVGVGTDLFNGSHIGTFAAPRIAAPIDWVSYMGDFDFNAVVLDTHSNVIYDFGQFQSTRSIDNGAVPNVYKINSYGGFFQKSTCSQLALAYCGDRILVSWTMTDDHSPSVRNGSQEVVQAKLSWSGEPANEHNPPHPYVYSIVNLKETGNQSASSVAGRFTPSLLLPGNARPNGMYCFFDEDDREVYHKSSDYNDTNLRQAARALPPQQPVTAYPNPFREETTLTLTLADNEAVQALQVYDPMGQPVRGLKLPTARGAQQVRWDAAGLKPGLYQVRVRTSAGNTYTYRVQHE